jgi:hypothetical protein
MYQIESYTNIGYLHKMSLRVMETKVTMNQYIVEIQVLGKSPNLRQVVSGLYMEWDM